MSFPLSKKIQVSAACKTLLFLTTLLFSAVVAPTLQAQNQLIDQVVAVVGDKMVLASDIEIQALQAKSQGYSAADLHCQIMEQLLLEKMFLYWAEVDSVAIDDGEIDLEIDNRLNYFLQMFGGDVAKMEEYYGKTMLEMKDQFRTELRDQMLARKMQQQIISDVKVTPSEVKSYFQSIPRDSLPYLDAEVELAEIIIKPKLSREQKEIVRQQLLSLKKRIEGGEDFEKLAKGVSQDPGSGAKGGDLGWTKRGAFVPEFEGAAYKLKPGELSDPVESAFGFHLIQLLERRGEEIHARHILLIPDISYTEAEQAKKHLDSIRTLILRDTISFRKAVDKFTEDDLSKKRGGLIMNQQRGTTTFSIKELDPTLYFTIDTLEAGEVSFPSEFLQTDGRKAFRIVQVISRTKPHVANLKDDYTKIQDVVEARKKQDLLQDWFGRRINRTYVMLKDQYKGGCENMERWEKLRK